MEPLHRAKVELTYTRTIKARYEAKVVEKINGYNEKIERLEKFINEAEESK